MLTEFDSKLYKQIVGILMRTNCALLVADLVLVCYDRDLIVASLPILLRCSNLLHLDD